MGRLFVSASTTAIFRYSHNSPIADRQVPQNLYRVTVDTPEPARAIVPGEYKTMDAVFIRLADKSCPEVMRPPWVLSVSKLLTVSSSWP
jgi:hypothetical protein